MRVGEAAGALEELALSLELLAARPVRAQAYRAKAAELRSVGFERALGAAPAWLSRELEALATTGTCTALEEARAAVLPDALALAAAPGVGARVARCLFAKTHARTLDELRDTMRGGFLPRSIALEAPTRAAVERALPAPARMLSALGRDAAELLLAELTFRGGRVAIAGDLRRGLERLHEVVLVACEVSADEVVRALKHLDDVLLVRDIDRDEGGVRCVMQGRGPLRIRLTDRASWVLAVLEETGSSAHVAWLAREAAALGVTLSNVARVARDEAGVYHRLGLAYVAPELRVGAAGDVPDLLAEGALRGAFHVHSDWSDGSATISAMADAARRAGYEYLGISDHSVSAPYANGLDASRLVDQKSGIARARRDVRGIEILHGLEVDILADGSLDLPNEVLASLDFVIASVHSETRMGPREMTTRIVRALGNPLVTMLGHPTGRLLSGKSGYAFDLEAVARAARQNDTWLELNANGHRLDLPAPLLRRALVAGASFVVNPDAHAPEGLADLSLGEAMARRAGLPAHAVLNTLSPRALRRRLDERRRRGVTALAS